MYHLVLISIHGWNQNSVPAALGFACAKAARVMFLAGQTGWKVAFQQLEPGHVHQQSMRLCQHDDFTSTWIHLAIGIDCTQNENWITRN